MKISWEETEKLVKALAKKIDKDKIENIYGVPRGGLVVAVILSHLLKKPLVQQIERTFKKTLFVDDLTDTGLTLGHIEKVLGRQIISATLFHNRKSTYEPTYYVKTKPSEWIEFVWE